MLTVERLAKRDAWNLCHLPEGGGIGRKVEQEACPLTDTVVAEEQDGKECQQVQSCFEIGPKRDERESYRLGILASG